MKLVPTYRYAQVGEELHHVHDGHCDVHGALPLRKRVVGGAEYRSLLSPDQDEADRRRGSSKVRLYGDGYDCLRSAFEVLVFTL